ncbi:MAG: FKBP-type peptidyl-prolyl cis-trans isomerase, partial [Actinobacteria bacterium]|nr:FKBP-type peptidyl-prolyl cis-trans isomerase [Actinomycetota bacterium]
SDGSTFDTSRGRDPIEVRIGAGQVLPGFEEGLVGMNIGGTRRVIVPPELGYGPSGAGEIPPNETLTFELELVDIAPS